MQMPFKSAAVFVLWLSMLNAGYGEVLGKISDETDVVVEPVPAPTAGGKLIYRVICTPEDQDIPECAQAPVTDSFETRSAETPTEVVPPQPVETAVSNETPPEPVDRSVEKQEQSGLRKTSTHKKRSKAKKSGKKHSHSKKHRKR